jgi:hypothetical protein
MHGRARKLRLRTTSGAGPAPPEEAERTRPAAAVLALQQSVGNRAVVDVLARQPDTKTKPKPKVVTVEGEKVEVASDTEAKDAERILKLLKDSYGVAFDSLAVRNAVRKDKTERGVAKEDVDKIDVVPWTYMDLRNLEAGFKHFAPILGKARTKSKRKGTQQEVSKMGRLSHYQDNPEGQYVHEYGAIAIFKSHPRAIPDPDEFTTVHEIAHAVFGPMVEKFRRKIGYWTYPSAKRRDGSVEAPPTPYGDKNPDEDMADSVALYFTAPDVLRDGDRRKKRGQVGNACPKRFGWIDKEVKSW